MISDLDEKQLFEIQYRKNLLVSFSQYMQTYPVLYLGHVYNRYHSCETNNNLTNEYINVLKNKWISLPLIHKLTFLYYSNVDQCRMDVPTFTRMVDDMFAVYERSKIEHGTMVGVQAAQSVGESLTQMTLNSFHHTGTKKNIGYGVKRLRELLDASDTKQVFFSSSKNIDHLAEIKVNSVCDQTGIIFRPTEKYSSYVGFFTLSDTKWLLPLFTLIQSFIVPNRAKKKSVPEYCIMEEKTVYLHFSKITTLTEAKRHIILYAQKTIMGIPCTEVIDPNTLLVKAKTIHNFDSFYSADASCLLKTLNTNDIHFILQNLGIDAVREYLFRELKRVLRAEGIELNTRHLSLIVDSMTFSGDVHANRYNALQIEDAVMIKASFQQATTTFGNAASKNIRDSLNDVSAQIMTGKLPVVGIGYTHLVTPVVEKTPVYDDGFEPEMAVFEPEPETISTVQEYFPCEEDYDEDVIMEPNLIL